jgi:hypothetical protein
VDEAFLFESGERPAHVSRDLADAAGREGALPQQHLQQVFAVHELHGEVATIAVLARVDRVHEVGMAEPRQRARLFQEAFFRLGIPRQLRQQHFQRDPLLEPHVAGLENRAHAPHADAPHELVVADPRLAQRQTESIPQAARLFLRQVIPLDEDLVDGLLEA